MSIGHKRPEASSSFAILPSPARLLRRIQKFSRRCLLQDFPVQLCNNTDTYSHANHYSELNHFGLSDLQVQRQHRIKLNHQAQAWEKPCVRPLRAHSTHAVLAWCGAKVLGITPPLCALQGHAKEFLCRGQGFFFARASLRFAQTVQMFIHGLAATLPKHLHGKGKNLNVNWFWGHATKDRLQ